MYVYIDSWHPKTNMREVVSGLLATDVCARLTIVTAHNCTRRDRTSCACLEGCGVGLAQIQFSDVGIEGMPVVR